MFVIYDYQRAAFEALSYDDQIAVMTWWAQILHWKMGWLVNNYPLGLGFDSDYSLFSILGRVSIDLPPSSYEGTTITFTSHPPNGYIGYCWSADCGDGVVRGIYLNYEYTLEGKYWFFWGTADSWNGDGTHHTNYFNEEMTEWFLAHFVWYVYEPVALDDSMIMAILSPYIDFENPPDLTLTVLWHADVDLDLYLSCGDGTEIGYGGSPSCSGRVDKDMMAADMTYVRGDGSEGQIENISLDVAVPGTTYVGRIHYFSGQEGANARFSAIISGVTSAGELTVYYQHDHEEYIMTYDGTDYHKPDDFTFDFFYEAP
jgi:hypothetical protein